MSKKRMRRLNELLPKWSDISDDYYIADDGFIYKKLKTGYYRSGKKHLYQQTRSTFGRGRGVPQITVHNAVATAVAFCPKPPGATDVDHINNDKTDNRAENLQWLSHRDNLRKKSKDKEAKA